MLLILGYDGVFRVNGINMGKCSHANIHNEEKTKAKGFRSGENHQRLPLVDSVFVCFHGKRVIVIWVSPSASFQARVPVRPTSVKKRSEPRSTSGGSRRNHITDKKAHILYPRWFMALLRSTLHGAICNGKGLVEAPYRSTIQAIAHPTTDYLSPPPFTAFGFTHNAKDESVETRP